MRFECLALGRERFHLDAATAGEVRRLHTTNPKAALDLARRRQPSGPLPEGASVVIPALLADGLSPNLISFGVPAMNTPTKTVTILDGTTITTDAAAADAIASLSGQLAALRTVVQDRAAVNDERKTLADAARTAVLDAERARRDPSTPYGKHLANLRTAYRGAPNAGPAAAR